MVWSSFLGVCYNHIILGLWQGTMTGKEANNATYTSCIHLSSDRQQQMGCDFSARQEATMTMLPLAGKAMCKMCTLQIYTTFMGHGYEH